MISINQIEAALGLLHMDRKDLAEEVGVMSATLNTYFPKWSNPGKSVANMPTSTNKNIQRWFETQGLVFSTKGDDGVRRDTGLTVVTLEGSDGVRTFFDDVYETTKETKKEILIFNGMPQELIFHAGQDWYTEHADRMKALNVTSKNIIEEGETKLIGKSFAQYKYAPKEMFRDKMIYVYGDKFAFMSFDNNAHIKILKESDIADSLRDLINLAWEHMAQD